MKKRSAYIKNIAITLGILCLSFAIGLLLQTIFNVQATIPTVFVFAVFSAFRPQIYKFSLRFSFFRQGIFNHFVYKWEGNKEKEIFQDKKNAAVLLFPHIFRLFFLIELYSNNTLSEGKTQVQM